MTATAEQISCTAIGPHHGDPCDGGRIQSPNSQFTQNCHACKGTGLVSANRHRATAWLTGWSCGAAFLPIPPHYLQDPDFSDGWRVGREAKKQARHSAELLFGHTFAVVNLQEAAAEGKE